jgi:hypothetical protein
MAAESETSVSNTDVSAPEAVPSKITADVIRQQIHRQRRRRMRSARRDFKHKKRMRIFLIGLAEAFFLFLLVYVWFKVSSAVQ